MKTADRPLTNLGKVILPSIAINLAVMWVLRDQLVRTPPTGPCWRGRAG